MQINALSAYEPLLTNTKYRYIVMRGGTGAGKTYHCYIRVLTRILSETPHVYLCMRKYGTTIRHSIWEGFIGMITQLDLWHMFEVNRSDFTITCKNGKAISIQEWEDTCDYYISHSPEYAKRWLPRKGKAVHTLSDFGRPLITWDQKESCPFLFKIH